MTDKSIATLALEVQGLSDQLVAAQKETQMARSAETALINKLNNAQKELDLSLSELRGTAPMGSDWANAKITRVMVSP